MSFTMLALPGRIRDVVLRLLGRVAETLSHDRDRPPDGDRPSRIWPAVL
jgi:hypothetical protein